jgi:hypothetical protein
MATPIGTLEFFALEAGEYLERLAQLVGRPGGPAADELVRYARALRGSALMANQQPMSRAAGGLEAVGRALREGRRQWDAECAEVAGQAVDELKGLLRRVTQWDADDDARAARVTEGLQALAGPAPEPATRRPADRRAPAGPDAGIRAFVAREAALVAGALDRAARAVAVDPADPAALHTVLRRMQSLRGLASLSDLPPLPDLLDGIERAITGLSRMASPPPEASELFAAAARALTRASTEVAGTGRPDPAAAETTAFAERLVAAFVLEPDVMPVESLAPAGAESVSSRGREPAASPPTAPELVGLGEFLVQAADDLEQAAAPALRALRLQALAASLMTGARSGNTALGAAFARLLAGARAAATRPGFEPEPGFADDLRAAGMLLRSAGPGTDPGDLGGRLADRLRGAVAAAGPTAAAPTVPPPAPAVDLEALAPEPSRPAPAPSPIPARTAPGPEPVPVADLLAHESGATNGDQVPPSILSLLAEPADLAGTFTTLYRLRAGGSATVVDAVPTGPATLDVRDLVYRGRRALDRALELRAALATRLADGEPSDRWRPLLDELFDILPLAAEDA